MTDGSHIEQITHTMNNVARVVDAQVKNIGHESLRFTDLQNQTAALTEGADEANAQQIPHLFGVAANKSNEAIAALNAAQVALKTYVGRLALSEVGNVPSDSPRDGRPKTQATSRETEVTQKSNKLTAPVRRELFRKAYFTKRYLADGSLPSSEDDMAMIAHAKSLADNYERQKNESSDFAELVHDLMNKSQPHDVFVLAEKAKAIADALYGDVTDPDMADLAMAAHYYSELVGELFSQYPDNADVNGWALNITTAVHAELAQRVPVDAFWQGEEVSVADLRKRIFKDPESARDQQIADGRMAILEQAVSSRKRLDNYVALLGLSSNMDTTNDYNKSFAPGEQDALNETAADTIESVHLLQSHGVTPMVISGEKIGLSADLLIAPPVNDEITAYKDGVLADFFFIEPARENMPDHGLIRKEQRDKGECIVIGQNETMFRLRLHNNGQISHGDSVHNIPSDMAERCFQEVGAQDAFDRLRGLLISIAYDAVVPQDVVDRTGSVATHFGARENNPPNQEPVTDLLLHRQRVLRQANVNDRNRQPTGWVWPERTVEGYMRRLPEGYKPRPGAEEEARKYYEDRGWAFDGLPEGKTFVGEYTRGTGPASVTARKASFRPASRTRLFLKRNK